MYTKADKQSLLNHSYAENVIAKLAEKAKNAHTLADLWANPPSFSGHVEKRIKQGHAKNVADYFDKVKSTLASADKFNVVANRS